MRVRVVVVDDEHGLDGPADRRGIAPDALAFGAQRGIEVGEPVERVGGDVPGEQLGSVYSSGSVDVAENSRILLDTTANLSEYIICGRVELPFPPVRRPMSLSNRKRGSIEGCAVVCPQLLSHCGTHHYR